MPICAENYDPYLTEHELSSPLDHDKVEHDIHCFDIDRKGAEILSRETKHPHRHGYQEICWLRSGPAKQLLDGDCVDVPPLTILIVPQGRVHWFRPSEMVEGRIVRFRDNFLPASSSTLLSQFQGPSHISIPRQDITVIESLFSVIREEYRVFNQYQGNTIKFGLQTLIAKIEEVQWRAFEKQHPSFTGKRKFWKEFNELVERYFRSEHGVVFYARELGVTPRKLNELVRPLLGRSAAEAIDGRRLLEAKRLILFSGLNIKEIAFELGYDEHSYFTRVFKKVNGLTPSEFRQNNISA